MYSFIWRTAIIYKIKEISSSTPGLSMMTLASVTLTVHFLVTWLGDVWEPASPHSPGLSRLFNPLLLGLTLLLASSWGCVNRLGRFMWVKEIGKSTTFPPPPPCQCSREETLAGSPIFLTLPLLGQHRLLFARAGRTQPIRMEETYTPMMMKPARVGICDK
jgi:hypothetical protein